MRALATLDQEAYTPFEDVFVPHAPFPFSIHLETYAFGAVVRKVDGEGEFGSTIFVRHRDIDRNITAYRRAEVEVERAQAFYGDSFRLISKAAINLKHVPPMRDVDGKVWNEPVLLIFESKGFRDNDRATPSYPRDTIIQRVVFVPISPDEIVTIQMVRLLDNDNERSKLSQQWSAFLDSVQLRVANTTDTLKGRSLETRRYYTSALEFEVPVANEAGENQWVPDAMPRRSEVWRTPEGELGIGLRIQHTEQPDVDAVNQRLRSTARGTARNLLGVVRRMDPEQAEGVTVDYVEKPFGDATIYGTRTDDEYDAQLKLELAYKPGQQLHVFMKGSSKAVEAHEGAFYEWLAKFKWLE